MPGAGELHELDPVRGLPEHLPEGETLLWQGQPEWWSLCRRAFHVGLIGAYFLIVTVWRAASYEPAQEQMGLLVVVALSLLPGVLAVGAFMLLALLICRTTIYSITNRRAVMQFGIALPINLNLPFSRIEGAGHRRYRDGTGDIPLQLGGGERVAYLLLWPHARPWHVRNPQPMLRCLSDSETVAAMLAEALHAFHETEGVVASDAASDASPSAPRTAEAPGVG
jgi:hypothetical protein